MDGQTKIQEIKKVRTALGLSLRQSVDAIEVYKTAERAIAALSPETANKNDPMANAVMQTELWKTKAFHLRQGLNHIINITVDPEVKAAAQDAIDRASQM